jgi:murein DD-endopeptidase MepM/ murein hydrolase activator NlpD
MSDNFLTLMIGPRKNGTTKKISISRALLRILCVGSVFAVFLAFYALYDYAGIKSDQAELARLQAQTKEQSLQIIYLAAKVNRFADRMEDLNQYDKKIRILADFQTKEDKIIPLGIGGSSPEGSKIKDLFHQDNQKLIAEVNKSVGNLNDAASIRERSFAELLNFLQEQKSVYTAIPLIWPVRGWVTSEFGTRVSPFGAGIEFHRGLDIATRMGKEVLATAAGFVADAGYYSAEGNLVKIDHGHGFTTAYAHLARIAVAPGTRVKKGQVIGFVGDTGRSTGSHLHYAVYINDIPVNPRRYLR